MDANLFERVRGIALDVFQCPARLITAGSSPEDIDTWNSTRHLNFILALEETFQLQLSPEEIERIRTVGQAAELIQEKIGLKEK